MRAKADASRAQRALGTNLGLLGSVLVHALAYAVLSWAGTMPAVDFELKLPKEVELGLTEPTPKAANDSVPTVPAAATQADQQVPAASAKPKPKPKHKQPTDAGVDAATRSPSDAGPRKASASDAGLAPSDAGRPLLSAYAPAGAQIALRLHMGRVRDSDLAEDVRSLLDAVPDWRAIVDGSGLDPLHDLERLYLASPDLQRERVVIAGQYVGGPEVPRRAVANLAAARGVVASWRNHGPIAVAPWANADETARIVALIAPQQFAITRPDDLPRVLQIARALAQRKAKPGGAAVTDPGEALLGLEQGELLALSIEGAHLFARGDLQGIPDRLELSVRKRDEGGLDLQINGYFETPAKAEQANRYWAETRDRFASHPLVAFIGMREPLVGAQLKVEGSTLVVESTIALQQARVLLGFVHNALERAPAATGRGKDAPPPGDPGSQRVPRLSSPSP